MEGLTLVTIVVREQCGMRKGLDMPGARTAPGRALVVGLVVIGCLLAGCGRPNPYALPEYATGQDGSNPAPTATAPGAGASRGDDVTPVATPSPQVHYSPSDALGQGAWVEAGRIDARTPDQRAVVSALRRYLSVWVRLSNTWQVDEQALAASATGEAVTRARERAAQQRRDDRRSIGRFIMNVSSVQVDGDSATVSGCHFDATSEVDRDGNVLVAPPGGVLITMQLERTGHTWRVLGWPDRSIPSCDWRS
jgi:hypothetical protein